MIRVIVPTMWKYPPFWDLVEYILEVDVVSEFFIINNDERNTPVLDILNHPKIKMVSFGKNIGVNPAWNCGALGSNSDILCILNDDLIFDIKVFYKIANFLNDTMGMICLSEQRPASEGWVYPPTTGDLRFTPYVDENMTERYGYGVLYFIHKNNWIDIPDKLQIFYGDNFVFDQCYYRGLQNYMMHDLFHYHAGAQTSIVPRGNPELNRTEEEAYFNEYLPLLIKNELKGLL